MKIWVLTYQNSTGPISLCDSVCGVFSTWDKARDRMYKYLKNYNEMVQGMDFNEFTEVYLWYTNQSIYKIKSIMLDKT